MVQGAGVVGVGGGGAFARGEDVMKVDADCSCVEGRIAWTKEVVPREGSWGREAGDHFSCEKGPWEVFKFDLGWGGDEENWGVRGGCLVERECVVVGDDFISIILAGLDRKELRRGVGND